MRVDWVAIHESSHAVIGERLGQPVRAITCVPGPGYGGFVSYAAYATGNADASSLRRLRLRLRAEGISALAGAAGQSRFTHEPVHMILQRCDGDRRDARRCATMYALSLPEWSTDTRREVFDSWLDETKDLVFSNWAVITALAHKLSLNGTLAACDVARIIALADRAAA